MVFGLALLNNAKESENNNHQKMIRQSIRLSLLGHAATDFVVSLSVCVILLLFYY